MKFVLPGESTNRLNFRLLNEDDFNDWLPLFKSKDAVRFLGLDPSKSEQELCEIWFNKAFDRYENDLGGLNVLTDKMTGEMIGQCGILIQDVEGEMIFEVGYSILPKFWGQGYASEAAIKCKQEAFQRNITNRIHSIVHVENHGSAAVARKNGMEILKNIPDFKGFPVNLFYVDKLN